MATFPQGSAGQTALVALVQPPAPGRSKVRLCPPLTLGQAFDLATALTQDALGVLARVSGVTPIVLCPPGTADRTKEGLLVPSPFAVVEQRSSGLGAAWAEAVVRACDAGFGRVVVAVADCPTLPVAYVDEAIHLLAENDMILGPANDGGYYALGLKHAHPRLFEGISWGTEWVLAQTLVAARDLGLRRALLPIWYDVDTAEELDRLVFDLTAQQDVAPATRSCLKQCGFLPER